MNINDVWGRINLKFEIFAEHTMLCFRKRTSCVEINWTFFWSSSRRKCTQRRRRQAVKAHSVSAAAVQYCSMHLLFLPQQRLL